MKSTFFCIIWDMEETKATNFRKLAAILFADIEGYTNLMQEGESNAMRVLNRFQKVTAESAHSCFGEVVKSYGDGSLLIFDSTVDAVKCAVDMQKAFREDPVVPLRIGIHIGEVVRKDKDVFGNGVNIASRIESMAVAGSILVSEDAQRHLKNQEYFSLTSLGQFEFKNVAEPIEVFALTNDQLAVPKGDQIKGKFKEKEKTLKKGPLWALFGIILVALLSFIYYFYQNKNRDLIPRIAINAFSNEGNADDDYYTRSFTAELTSALSGLKNISVVPINTLQNSTMSLVETGKSLDVDYILSGSVFRTEDDRVTINPTLIKARDGSQVWGQLFSKMSGDAMDIKSEITYQLMNALKIQLTEEENKLLDSPPTKNPIAYDAFMKGLDVLPPSHGSREDYEKAISLFQQATMLDTSFAKAWAYLGIAHRGLHLFGYDMQTSRLDSFIKYIDIAESIDPGLYEVALSKARYKKYLYDYDGSRKLFSELLRKRPNDPNILFENSFNWQREGFIEEALETKMRVRELDPKNLEVQLETAWTSLFLQDYELAFACRDAALAIDPNSEWGYLAGAIIHWCRGKPGDLEKAGQILDQVPNTESSYTTWFWILQKMFEGDYNSALNVIQNYPYPAIERQDAYYPKTLVIGIIKSMMGEDEEAKKEFQASLSHMIDKIKVNPDDYKYRNAMGMVFAGLGKKKEAEAELVKSAELMPKDKDYLYGLYNLYEHMKIYAMLGEDDRALDVMAEMLSRPNPFHGLYFTNEPLFSKLQTNPRFIDLMKKSNKSKLLG